MVRLEGRRGCPVEHLSARAELGGVWWCSLGEPCMEHCAHDLLQVAHGDFAAGVAGIDGLALLGHTQPSPQGALGLGANRAVGWPAAPPNCAAASVDHGEQDPMGVRHIRQCELGLAQRDLARHVAGLLAGVRITKHHFELVADGGAYRGRREHRRR
jgi:hypothetical protein